MNSAKSPQDARVDASWIASHIDDPSVRCVEVDVSGAAYKSEHIPGAVLWNAYTDLRLPDYRPISAPELQALLCRSGVTPDMTVVFYGYGAHLGFWLLKSCGHDRVRLMDGSRDQWRIAGQNWSTDVATPARSQYVPAARDAYASAKDGVREMIGLPNRVILDTRSKAEYDGERFWPSGATEGAGRPGRIPGLQERERDDAGGARPRHRSGNRSRHVLYGRHSREPGVVCVEISSWMPRRAGLLRLLGRVGQQSLARRRSLLGW